MQTWTNVLNYIKRQLGAKLNLLELSDSEIIEGLIDDTMPEFSQYSPARKVVRFDMRDLVGERNTGMHFSFKLDTPDFIVDIYEVYPSTHDGIFDDMTEMSSKTGSINFNTFGTGSTGVSGGSMIDVVIDNQYVDMMKFLSTKLTWEFLPPNILMFDTRVTGGLVVYNTYHTELDSINPDQYNLVFKKMCLMSTIDWIIALRSKYESVASPLGEMTMNISALETKRQDLKTQVDEFLNSLPPDHFVHIC